MSDGGRFRAEPTGTRVLARRGRPLSTRIAAIVAVALVAGFSSTIAIAYPFVRASAVEQARIALGTQADALARFLDSGSQLRQTPSAIPAAILEMLRNKQVSALLVPSGSTAPLMFDSDVSPSVRRNSVSDIRRDAQGQWVLYEYRGLDEGYSLVVTEPESVADEPTRSLLWKMGLGAIAALCLAMGAVFFYTRRATAPIRNAVSAAERMAEGSRDVRLVEGGVAEIADLSRSMNELSDALANSEDRLRQFLLSVSHELRTPLTAITGYAEALRDGIITGEDAGETGVIVHAEAERLQRLVSDLLDLSRAGSVALRLDPQTIDLRELVTDAGRVWRDRCDREDVHFRLEVPDAPLSVTTDAVRVRQIIDNLCENALRVTPAGRPLVLALRPKSDGVDIEVRDGGPGLADEDLPVAFRPSVLHDRYVGIRPVGTGVGLAIVASLANRLGGVAHAGRAPEGGAAFVVHLPSAWSPVPTSGAHPGNP